MRKEKWLYGLISKSTRKEMIYTSIVLQIITVAILSIYLLGIGGEHLLFLIYVLALASLTCEIQLLRLYWDDKVDENK